MSTTEFFTGAKKERPIMFSTDMVQAILDGRKTVTRRIKKHSFCPYGEPGDLLYVRETWNYSNAGEELPLEYYYKADGHSEEFVKAIGGWKPSIHLPKNASRIWLEIIDVKVERLHDITINGAIKEGISMKYHDEFTERDAFAELWDRINKKRAAWTSNPWVWVITFEKIEKP